MYLGFKNSWWKLYQIAQSYWSRWVVCNESSAQVGILESHLMYIPWCQWDLYLWYDSHLEHLVAPLCPYSYVFCQLKHIYSPWQLTDTCTFVYIHRSAIYSTCHLLTSRDQGNNAPKSKLDLHLLQLSSFICKQINFLLSLHKYYQLFPIYIHGKISITEWNADNLCNQCKSS